MILIILILLIIQLYYIYYCNDNINITNIKNVNYKKQKVCILLSGGIRDNNTLNVLISQKIFIYDKLDCDIFCVFNDNVEQITELKKNDIIKFLKPKEILWVNDDFLNNHSKRIETNIYKMYYKLYLCNNLKIKYEKEKKFIYDVVIRMRPDIIMKESFPNNIINNINNNICYTSYLKFTYPGIADFILISTSYTANKLYLLYNFINMNNYNNHITYPTAEYILKIYLELNNIYVEKFKVDYIPIHFTAKYNKIFLKVAYYILQKHIDIRKYEIMKR
jgi:hypothetical protein